MIFFPCEFIFKSKACNAPLYEKSCSIQVRHYAARLIDLNEYLASLTGAIIADKIGVNELNKILLNIMPNIWSRQAYAQVLYCESISFKIPSMFERTEIAERIYKGVVTPSYLKTN